MIVNNVLIMKDKKDIISEHIAQCLSAEGTNNMKQIKDEIEYSVYGGKYCTDGTNVFYIVGATSTDEDYYYIGIDKFRTIKFLSCVACLKVVDEYNINFSVLDYLIKHEPETIAADVKRYINSIDTDVLFTKININGKLY